MQNLGLPSFRRVITTGELQGLLEGRTTPSSNILSNSLSIIACMARFLGRYRCLTSVESQVFLQELLGLGLLFFSRSVIGIGSLMANVALLFLFLPGVMSVPLRSIWSPNLDKTSIPRRTAGFKVGNSRNSAAIVSPAAVMSLVSSSPKDISDPSARIATSVLFTLCQPSSRHWWLVSRST